MRARWPLVAGGVAVVVAGGVLAVSMLGGSPELLDEADFTGVESAQHGETAYPPGWTWCDLGVGRWFSEDAPVSSLTFGDHAWAAAAIVARPGTWTSQEVLDALETAADACADSELVDRGNSIEPLDGLAPGEVGWTTEAADGERGAYALVPLDETRVLAVGYTTLEDDPPVDVHELVERAKDGAAQFSATGG